MEFIITVPHFAVSNSIEKAVFFDDACYLFTVEKKANNYFGKQVVFQENWARGIHLHEQNKSAFEREVRVTFHNFLKAMLLNLVLKTFKFLELSKPGFSFYHERSSRSIQSRVNCILLLFVTVEKGFLQDIYRTFKVLIPYQRVEISVN